MFLPTESILFSQSGGGGGWGDPRNRDPQAVLDDVLDEVVSLEGARRDYGVVIDPDSWVIDAAATERERAHQRTSQTEAAE